MLKKSTIVYRRERDIDATESERLLAQSRLGAIQPIADPDRLRRMLTGSQLVITARDEEDLRLLGVARCVTDFAWCCYLSELVVAREAQGLGIGRELVAAVRAEIGPEVALFISSVPEAAGFYERIGMERMEDVFRFQRER